MLGHHHEKMLTRAGAFAGIAVAAMYLVPRVAPVGFLSTYLFIYQGPLLVVAFVGLYPLLSRPTPVLALLGSLFGVVAGVCRMLFSVVQMTNIEYLDSYMRGARTPEAAQSWQDILTGVFTVQNGISYVMDFFLDWAVLLFALAMWRHPRFGKVFTITGFAAAGSHLVMKAYTFPKPPAEAGLLDAGPLVALWATIVFVWVLRSLRWLDGHPSQSAA
jgi:hypothetical protein